MGAADSGKASQITKLTPSVTDASFDTTVISFMPNGGNAAITLTSASTSQFLVMSGMSLESVPEPAAALLSGLGLLALLRRRRA